MATRDKIIRGTGTLSGQGRKRQCQFQVTRHEMMVDAGPTGRFTYSGLSITDSDDWPDGNYELDYLGMKEPS